MSSITVGVYLGKKDRLVRYWYEVLPKGQFPMLVKYCIQSYLRSTYFPLNSVCDPGQLKDFVQARDEYPPTQRNVTFNVEDGPVYKWIQSLESGYRSEEIKNILKETVVNTLLMEQQQQEPAYAAASSKMGYNPNMMEDSYRRETGWDPNHGMEPQRKKMVNSPNLVNYLG